MAVSFQNQLASSCPHFVRGLRVHHSRIVTNTGADYYFIDSSYNVIKVAFSLATPCDDYGYIADPNFVKKYSCLFDLGHAFRWKTYENLQAWMTRIVAQRPKFIEPYYRSSIQFAIPQRLRQGGGYHASWFISTIADIHENMTVAIPRCFRPYLYAPQQAVAIVNSGNRRWYVKLEKGVLTKGWDEVVNAHDLDLGYCLLFATVGHLQFDLFIFNQDGNEMNYEWTTTLPIQQWNAPPGWDAEIAMSNVNGSVAKTACPPSSFRACRNAHRCALLLRHADLQKLEMTAEFKTSFQVQHSQELTLVSKQREWIVEYSNGYITGKGWLDFVATHALNAGNTLVLSPDINMKLYTLIIGYSDHERLYDW